MLPGVIGLIEATEAIKFLLGWGESLIGRLLMYDAVTMRFREVPLSRNPKCPLSGANPTISINTRDLLTFLGAVSISAGLSCTGTSTFVLQERSDGGTFLSSSTATHEKLTATKGFIYPTSISASQDGDDGAVCEANFVALWDGTNLPVVWNTASAINTLTAPSFVGRYFLGPVYHNGSQINGLTNVTINPGIEYTARAFSGEPYPKIGSIMARNPSIQFTVTEAAAASTLTMIHGSAISTSLAVYLQKGVASGTRVAAATAQHIKISAASGDWSLDEASAQQNDDGTLTFTATPTTTLAFSAASAIP